MDGIIDEKFEAGLEKVGYIDGTDKEGRPLLYTVFEPLRDTAIFHRLIQMKGQFLRWRVQHVEQVMHKLNFKNGGVDSMVSIIDMKNWQMGTPEYGGLKRGKDVDFSPKDQFSELTIRPGVRNGIKIVVTEPGETVVWEAMGVGWGVTYKEEFVLENECSDIILIQLEKKIGSEC
ncbi:hypothetical protein GIB67_026854 [Kingdonia uniflora]|uniref:Uncharacterized protein n=1 Tax=Kingdonia uniflora TaxID=39325 RepID=A0A7J7M7T5_9MAGN|nr:hypothetical protein GIB67_026854 [Kingdonia uniflora]